MLTTVFAPTTVTKAETFLWYRPTTRLQIGTAYLWKQGAFRALGNYEVIPETDDHPNLRVGFGVQGIGTGNPGYFATSEKSWQVDDAWVNGYLGVGFRSNEDHAHLLAGLKYSEGPWTLGVQADGHAMHPFATRRLNDEVTAGLYLIESKSLGVMVSVAKR